METVIKTEGLWKIYNEGRRHEVQALTDINIEIKKNGYAVLIGPSGSGKTTLLSLISSLDRPSRGKVFLFGEDLSTLSDLTLSKLRREKIGFVFQNFNLMAGVLAWENVSYPLFPYVHSAKTRYQRATEILGKLGLSHRINNTPEELSGGEQQRVAIARALVNEPEILFADEPTSNIDQDSTTGLLDIFSELWNSGRTLIVTSHDPILYNNPMVRTKFFIKEGKLIDRGGTS